MQTLFRVWDVFLVDGLDVLFRVALEILRSNESELLACQSIPAVYVALENLPTRMWEADKLLQVGSSMRLQICFVAIANLVNSLKLISGALSCILTSCKRGKHTSLLLTNCYHKRCTRLSIIYQVSQVESVEIAL